MPNDREFWDWFWPAEEMYSSAAEMESEPSIKALIEEIHKANQDDRIENRYFIQRLVNKTNPN